MIVSVMIEMEVGAMLNNFKNEHANLDNKSG